MGVTVHGSWAQDALFRMWLCTELACWCEALLCVRCETFLKKWSGTRCNTCWHCLQLTAKMAFYVYEIITMSLFILSLKIIWAQVNIKRQIIKSKCQFIESIFDLLSCYFNPWMSNTKIESNQDGALQKDWLVPWVLFNTNASPRHVWNESFRF